MEIRANGNLMAQGGRLLAMMRAGARMTLGEVAEVADVTKQCVSKQEKARNISFKTFQRLADAMGYECELILTKKEEIDE